MPRRGGGRGGVRVRAQREGVRLITQIRKDGDREGEDETHWDSGAKDGEDRSRQRKERGGEKWSSGKREDARERLQHQGLEPHHGKLISQES